MDHLIAILLLLAVTIVVVLGFQRCSIPTSLGYLLVGIILGPYTFGPTVHIPELETWAEFGVVFLLFTIGLNYSLPQLQALRHRVLGFGTGQVLLTTIVVMLLLWVIGVPATVAFVFGAIFAQSSTTIIASLLKEQGEENTQHGRLGLAMSVFQDVTAVPFLVIIPVLGVTIAMEALALALGWAVLKAVAAFLLVFFLGRWLLRPLFHIVLAQKSSEVFTLAVLLVALLAASTTYSFGLSLAFGGFIVGMVLGETEFRHQIESSIRPFRDVLLGLFFVGIGMRLDPQALLPIWYWALAGGVLIAFSKITVVTLMLRLSGVDTQVAWRTGLLLSVGGEFGLALVAIALDATVLDRQLGQTAIAAVLVAMIIGAVLIRFNAQISSRLTPSSSPHTPNEPETIPPQQVVIAGYGRVGHTIAVLLHNSGRSFVAFDTQLERIAFGQQEGHRVLYGDMADPELLSAIHIEHAALVILTVDCTTTALKIAHYLQQSYPQLPIIARARDIDGSRCMQQAGVAVAYPETIEASLQLGVAALQMLNTPQEQIDDMIENVRAWNYQTIIKQTR